MALIVENGTIVSNADSYVTRAEAIAFAANRGVTLADSTATDTICRKAAAYLESFRSQYKGEIVERDQPLAWPRDDVVIEGFTWASGEIPRQVVSAQLAVILEVAADIDPFNPPAAQGPVTQKSVAGAVSVSYAAGSTGSIKVNKDREATALINLLLKKNGLYAVRA